MLTRNISHEHNLSSSCDDKGPGRAGEGLRCLLELPFAINSPHGPRTGGRVVKEQIIIGAYNAGPPRRESWLLRDDEFRRRGTIDVTNRSCAAAGVVEQHVTVMLQEFVVPSWQ